MNYLLHFFYLYKIKEKCKYLICSFICSFLFYVNITSIAVPRTDIMFVRFKQPEYNNQNTHAHNYQHTHTIKIILNNQLSHTPRELLETSLLCGFVHPSRQTQGFEQLAKWCCLRQLIQANLVWPSSSVLKLR